MKYAIRDIDIENDKEFILESHCKINFNCDSKWAVEPGYNNYRDKWFSTEDPNKFLKALTKNLKDNRTLGLIVQDGIKKIGYCWVSFYDIKDYDISIAEINDILIIDEYKNKGIATFLIEYIEEKCKLNGAKVLRSGTGINNLASIKLHEKLNFQTYRVEFEKIIL
jgi:GNAT superfamily N-acetyltransferase